MNNQPEIKTLKTLAILALGCFAVAFVIANLFELPGQVFQLTSFAQANENINREESAPLQKNIEKIQILSTSADLKIEFIDGNDFQVRLRGEGSKDSLPEKFIQSRDKKMEIVFEKSGPSGWSWSKSTDLKGLVQIPRVFSKKLSIKTVSGDIRMTGNTLSRFELNSVSGDTQIQEMEISIAKIQTVSGDVSFQSSAQELKIQTTSGDIVHSGKSERIKIKTVSGDGALEVQPVTKEIEIGTVSGDFDFKGNFKRKIRSELKSVSGDFDLPEGFSLIEKAGSVRAKSLSENPELIIKGKTVSGDIRFIEM